MTDPEPQDTPPFALPPSDPPAPAPEVYLKKPPIWSYFLTPAAVLVGAALIAGAIWLSSDDGESAAASPHGEDGAVSTVPTFPAMAPMATQPPAAGLLETFNIYARTLDLNLDQFGQCLGQQSNVVLLNEHFQRGAALGVNGTPTFFINNKRLVGAQPAAILQEIVQRELGPAPPTTLEEYSDAVRSLGDNFAIVAAGPDLAGAVIEGNPDAPVMIAEFSDFQCPFCKRWSEQVLPPLREALGDDVALAFLHYPITQIHPNAGNASVVAICAGEQGKFWEMHDLLFARQAEWSNLR
ncbi:MAG TPA: thioredoxin domain-containing protein [Tepidiformaceae bacterium]|nr:thioredoxin domain-containing protein [Tepidiformaceae bacterium]